MYLGRFLFALFFALGVLCFAALIYSSSPNLIQASEWASIVLASLGLFNPHLYHLFHCGTKGKGNRREWVSLIFGVGGAIVIFSLERYVFFVEDDKNRALTLGAALLFVATVLEVRGTIDKWAELKLGAETDFATSESGNIKLRDLRFEAWRVVGPNTERLPPPSEVQLAIHEGKSHD